MSLSPVWAGRGSGLREGIQALPPSVASLALLPSLQAEREGGDAGGPWCVSLTPDRWSVRSTLELCAAFDQPGLPCGLTGEVGLRIEPPSYGGPGALGACLGQCAELARRLRGGGANGLALTLWVYGGAGEGAGAGEEGGDGGAGEGGSGGSFLGRVLGAVLPAAAPHVRRLWLQLVFGAFPPGFSRHLAAPFPLLEGLELGEERSMAAGGVMQRSVPWRLRTLRPWHGSRAPPPCCAAVVRRGQCTGRHGAGPDPPTDVAALVQLAVLGRLYVGCGAIYVGCGAGPSPEQDVCSVLAVAGRGWVAVSWPPDPLAS